MIVRVCRAEASEVWGSRLVVAGLAAIEKGDSSFRVTHDGTHGVWVNPRIVARGQIRSPGIAEARVALQLSRRFTGAALGLKGDVSKAHRRVKVWQADWAYQACALEEGPDSDVFLNQVGAFGIGSAAYWWSRTAAAVARAAWSLVEQGAHVFQLVYVDDVLWILGLPAGRRSLGCLRGLVLVLAWTALGWPLPDVRRDVKRQRLDRKLSGEFGSH